ncbi:MAG: hypothetical protein JXA25_11320 [Anaerolineales bacterium]|nr:hypothetical protein [Anaerolineales bacterium]
MDETMRMWMESGFNIFYLVAVWSLVVLMAVRRRRGTGAEQRIRTLFLWMFVLLALGDTGHVGFRVVAYALGDVYTSINIAGGSISLIGLGSLSTSITVTLFYMLMVLLWKERSGKQMSPFAWFLLLCGAARLVILAFPQNQWSALVPPFNWSLIRNLPLTIQGLGVAALILRDAAAAENRLFRKIGICILVSYGFYMPVILFVQKVPLIGMLMIPKTLAYLAAAWIGYRGLFTGPATQELTTSGEA